MFQIQRAIITKWRKKNCIPLKLSYILISSFSNTPTKEELSGCFLYAEVKSLNSYDQSQMFFHCLVFEKFSTENGWVKP